MLLNQRQLEIILELFEKPETYMTASYFSEKHQCSLRTVQNDIKQIKAEIKEESCVTFETTTRKGCRVLINDSEDFIMLRDAYYQQFGANTANYPSGRTGQILHLLLKEHRAISMYDLETTIFVSHSTLLNDLKAVADVVKKYNLELLRGSNKVMIDGNEIYKRLCLMDQNLIVANAVLNPVDSEKNKPIEIIKNVLIETLVSFKHQITDTSLNNAILQLYVAMTRMQDWFYISPSDLEINEDLTLERAISKEVFEKLSREFFVRVPDSEIDYFALYMKGQGSFSSNDIISSDIDKLVHDALNEINNTQHIDLTDDINLRIALGIHSASLVVRIKYDMQLKNHLVEYIKQTFPQGFELGIHFADYLEHVFLKKVTDDEIAFIAIHMYSALEKLHQKKNTRKVLLITPIRQSESILLKQTLLNWSSDIAAHIDYKSADQITEQDLHDYEFFLTTEKNKYYDNGLAFYIDPFPSKQDRINLKLAIDGFQSLEDITSLFSKDLFQIRDDKTREKVVTNMCDMVVSYFEYEDNSFHDAVFARENMRSTYWGNGIAVPHPLTAVSSNSFVAVSVLPQSIEWDDMKNKTQLILMVCLGKNSQHAFHLWNYLSNVLSDKTFVERLMNKPTYEHFIELLKEVIANNFIK